MPTTKTTPRRPADQAVRERIASRLEESQIVEAAAGTGKTRILVERLLEVVASGAGELAGIVVVTFTEKAAGELKLRVREAIEHGRQREQARGGAGAERVRRLEQALEQLEEAHISTIHGFCADLLREHPVEAGVDPDFAVQGDEPTGLSLFEATFARWLDETRHALPPGLKRVLRRRPDYGSPITQLLQAASALLEHRDLPSLWAEVPFALAERVDAFVETSLRPLAAVLAEGVAARALPLEKVLPLLTLAEDLAPGQPRDYEELEARLWTLKVSRYLSIRRRHALAERLESAVETFLEAHEAFKAASGAQLAPLLQRELVPCLERYERAKRDSGQLDFFDLLLRARELLVGDASVRAELQRRFTHVFIDEFQDTDPLQAEILLLLCADDPAETELSKLRPQPGKLFIVGDPKQSIYRFRRADVTLYQGLRERLVGEGAAVELRLESSFRAVPPLQQAINAAFAPLLDGSEGQASYVPLAPFRPAHDEQPALVALPIPKPYGYGQRVTKKAVRRSEPEAVAAWIDWLLSESGWRVTTRRAPNEPVPVQAHHVCLLFKQLRTAWDGDLTRPYIEALERRGVPHVVVGGRSFFAREEVEALIAALRVIEWPADDLSVYATLRGPLFGFDDETLLLYQRAGGRFRAHKKAEDVDAEAESNASPVDAAATLAAEAAGAARVRAALALLGKLHGGRNHRPLAETVGRLLTETRCLAGFALRPNGEQAVASLLRLQELARRFQRSEALSFRSFIQYLEGQLEAEVADADNPLIEEDAGGVRMMSVHRAKGLEFPVVVLADVACGPQNRASELADRELGLYARALCGCAPRELQDRQEEQDAREAAEELRLLYVAATRARDILLVPTLPERKGHEERFESWLGPLDPILHAAPGETSPGSGRSSTGSALAAGVGAGWHTPQLGTHRVFWADLSRLELERPEAKPLRDWDLIKADGPRYAESVERHESWRAELDARIVSASERGWQARAATHVAHQGAFFTPALLRAARAVGTERARAAGADRLRAGEDARRFGTLVHAVLEHVDPTRADDVAHLLAVAKLCARLAGVEEGAAAEAAQRARAALAHPLLLRAAQAAECFREVPLVLRVDPPGEPPLLIEGIIDLVFREAATDEDLGGWVVVDYKTDVDPAAEHLDAYRRQVGFYVEALAALDGARAQGYLLFV